LPKLEVNSKKFSKSSRFPLADPKQRAQELALGALLYLAKDQELMARFLAETGFDAADLRSQAREPGFAAAMLDYLCSNESLLLAFAADQGIDPAEPEAARQYLVTGGGRDIS
jgi:hypothetical protein